MQYTKLGRTDIEVSRFCLGCMGFGEVREGPAAAAELILSPEELAYLEEPYVPHALVGVMAQNRR